MSLADYLAKNYLTADSEKKSKKRKRKNKDGGLVIDDDDNLGWKDKAEDDDEDAPMIGTHILVTSVLILSANKTQSAEGPSRNPKRSRKVAAQRPGQP